MSFFGDVGKTFEKVGKVVGAGAVGGGVGLFLGGALGGWLGLAYGLGKGSKDVISGQSDYLRTLYQTAAPAAAAGLLLAPSAVAVGAGAKITSAGSYFTVAGSNVAYGSATAAQVATVGSQIAALPGAISAAGAAAMTKVGGWFSGGASKWILGGAAFAVLPKLLSGSGGAASQLVEKASSMFTGLPMDLGGTPIATGASINPYQPNLTGAAAPQEAGISTWLIIGLVGAGLYLIVKSK